MTVDPGSYRDPSGYVHIVGKRVLRTVTPHGQAEYAAVRDSGALKKLIERGALIAAAEVDGAALSNAGPDDVVLEHPRIPVVSYPYEWPFGALQAAALLHLDIQIELLDSDIALSDASAFNIQFHGGRPIFIDYLSFRRYRPNEPWLAHRQFCEQFLNPLVLHAKLGVPFHAWYRGQPDGIAIVDLAALLKLRHKLSPVLFSHVVLLARLQDKADESAIEAAQRAGDRGLSRSRFQAILQQLRNYIAGLSLVNVERTTWGAYASDNTYEIAETTAKRQFVERFAADAQPDLLIDLGSIPVIIARQHSSTAHSVSSASTATKVHSRALSLAPTPRALIFCRCTRTSRTPRRALAGIRASGEASANVSVKRKPFSRWRLYTTWPSRVMFHYPAWLT